MLENSKIVKRQHTTSMETAVVAVLSFDGVICMHYQPAPLKEAKRTGEPSWLRTKMGPNPIRICIYINCL